MARRSTIPPADVPCQGSGCPNLLLASEAVISRRALGATLCWRCRKHLGPRPTVHATPPGCSALVSGTGYGLWNAVLTAPDGRQFTGGAWTDYDPLFRAGRCGGCGSAAPLTPRRPQRASTFPAAVFSFTGYFPMSEQHTNGALPAEVTGDFQSRISAPTTVEWEHSKAKTREAVSLALTWRKTLCITDDAMPRDVWRLLALQGESIRLRRADIDGAYIAYLRDRPKCLTLRHGYGSPEVEANELLLMLGFALCAGPDNGFDYEALEAADTKEQLTRPVALAFREAFWWGEEQEEASAGAVEWRVAA